MQENQSNSNKHSVLSRFAANRVSTTGSIVVWLKYRRHWILFWGGLGLLVLASFGIGFLVGQEKSRTPIIIETHESQPR